ncbi:invasion associated locus B family protein [Tepidicaulis sp. LMO-SS28]|uniref:invasion associated locus B family protein n=1 Tax=Tepidicaulis sp. LMO-SS28 TaxID=3447455 RepID=UPI003EDF2BDB
MRKPISAFLKGAVAAAFLFSAAPALAETPRLLGTFNDWAAYTFGTGSDRICYAMTEPKEQLPRGVTRGDVFLMVTYRPSQNTRNEIGMRAGYVFDEKSNPYAEIGSDTFQMFTGVDKGGEARHWAWLENSSDENRMVNAMKRGSDMTIRGTSSRGTLTTDRYSLSGATAAMERVAEACK